MRTRADKLSRDVTRVVAMFLDCCDADTVAGLEAALYDAASREFDFAQTFSTPTGRRYASDRWVALTDAAKYVAAFAGSDRP